MQALIIFDVNTRNTEVKQGLRTMGYYGAWVTDKVTYTLPNNVVWKPDIELSAALKDLQNIINDLNNRGIRINLERCIVVSAHPWDGIPGSPV
jgi:hypothetical protein